MGIESGIKLGIWGVLVMLSLSAFMISWGYFVGADANTFCLFLIISLAVVFAALILFRTLKRAN